ncbi:CinA family protein [Tannockella kyphosi]|uniref:CinA family protein n=1 Tax=Tannockella kyphosi TaxID=2899121 RepID=UPI002012A15F|nr:CinA family protein [Tannockella kyphosi]
MEALVSLLNQHHLSISSVESFTVGKFASTLGAIPGVSKVYKGSFITYQNQCKEEILKIDASDIIQYGVVSKEIAQFMVENGNELLKTDICVSFTGNAGPEAMENKPVGRVYIGIMFLGKVEVYELTLQGSRENIQNRAIQFVIDTLSDKIKEIDKK